MKLTLKISYLVFALVCALPLSAQRLMERLDRSVVAMKVPEGVYVNWRITADEWYDVAYHLYRNGVKINEQPITGASNFLDKEGDATSVYTVTSVYRGVESAPSKAASVRTSDHITIKLKTRPSGYYINDCTTADLDGDGEYEIIVKRCYDDYSTSATLFPYFEAYKLDGTFLWEICVGPNILPNVEVNIAAFDFDGDNKAEVFMRTSEGTVFGDGTVIGDVGNEAGEFKPDGITNYRYGVNQTANMSYMIYGPEMLSLIDGETGREIDRVPFIPRGNANDWGDGYGHRCSKYFFGAPYLDGVHPSLFIGRGIYTKTIMHTYDVVNKKLVKRWEFNSEKQGGSWQGNHNYTIADVDGDGRDEIVWGQMCVDEYGQLQYTTNMGHGDAMHVGNLDPFRKGREVFSCLENSPQHGILYRDASTGQILMHKTTSKDCGRCCAGNISDAYPGAELWGGGYGYGASDLEHPVGHFGVAENYTIYWDGDLLKEICDHRNFSGSAGYGLGTITKFISHGNIKTLLAADARSCNYTKGTPCLQADILGDWREEVIWHSHDEQQLYIYTTPYYSDYRIYTLMHDHQYRQAICWQMCGYNQPPHPSFFLGEAEGMVIPPPPVATNGYLRWTGSGFVNDQGLPTSFQDGDRLLFDVSAENASFEINHAYQPDVLMVNSPSDYRLESKGGKLTGTGRLNKMGLGTLYLSGNHDYTGRTEVWEGRLQLDGHLQSPIWLGHFAELGGDFRSDKSVTMRYGAEFYIGNQPGDTVVINDTLFTAEKAVLHFDLSDSPSSEEASRNDYLKVKQFSFDAGSVIQLSLTDDSLGIGRYVLLEASEGITGNIDKLKLLGLKGFAGKLSVEDNSLILTTKGVRPASKVYWEGNESALWDRANTANWANELNDADIFVFGDTVVFDDRAARSPSITLNDDLQPAIIEVTSDTVHYTFSGEGAVSGNASLLKSGKSTLTIQNRNHFTGRTVLSGGKLEMRYAPTSTNDGGIGVNTSSTAYLSVSNNAVLQISTAGEKTNRGLSIGSGGMTLNVPSNLIWAGTIQGSTLTKTGNAQLRLSGNNSGLNELILSGGEVYLDEVDNRFTTAGKKLVLRNGTLVFHNNTGSYSSASVAMEVPSLCTATVYLDGRCSYTGALTGSGTLNLVTDFVRADMNGNWSAFAGKINITANSANKNYNDDFRIGNNYGYPQAWCHIGSGVHVYRSAGQGSVAFGQLTGVSDAYIENLAIEVGGRNLDGAFAGIISGSSSVTKIGTGNWQLSGTNTYTGVTKVQAGRLSVTGSVVSALSVAKGAVLDVTGKATGNAAIYGVLQGDGGTLGNVTVYADGVVSPSDSLSIGTLNATNLVLRTGAKVCMQVRSGITSTHDKIVLSNQLTCAGTLSISSLSQPSLLRVGKNYQLFSAESIQGEFEHIELPELSDGLEWDLSTLYTDGRIKIVKATSLESITVRARVLKNPTKGMFEFLLDESLPSGKLSIYSTNGTLVYEASIESSRQIVDLTSQPAGCYTARITTEANEVISVLRLKKE